MPNRDVNHDTEKSCDHCADRRQDVVWDCEGEGHSENRAAVDTTDTKTVNVRHVPTSSFPLSWTMAMINANVSPTHDETSACKTIMRCGFMSASECPDHNPDNEQGQSDECDSGPRFLRRSQWLCAATAAIAVPCVGRGTAPADQTDESNHYARDHQRVSDHN